MEIIDYKKFNIENIKKLFFDNIYTVSLYSRRIASAVVAFVLARFLTVYDYGLYSSYANIAAYLLIIADMNFSEYILVSSKNKVKQVKLKQSLFLVYALCVTTICALSSLFFNLEQKLIFALIIFKVFFDGTFFTLMLPYFQVTRKFKEISIINILYSFGIILIAISMYIFKLSLLKFVILSVLLGVINFIHCSISSKINYYMVITQFKRMFKYIDKTLKYFAGVSIVMLTQTRLYVLCISLFLIKEQAALFFAAFNIYTITQLFSLAQIQQLMPEMVALEGKELNKCINNGIKLLTSVFFGILIFFVIFGKQLLHIIYGKEYYINAYPVLIILSAIGILSFGGIYGCAISAKGMQKQKLKMQIEFLTVTILSVIALSRIKLYGFISVYAITSLYICIRYFIFYQNNIKNVEETKG